MKIVKSIIKLGSSKAITLPIEISKKVKIGEKYVFDIRLIDMIESEVKSYKCTVDEFIFHTSDEIPYCPICGSEKTVKEVFE